MDLTHPTAKEPMERLWEGEEEPEGWQHKPLNPSHTTGPIRSVALIYILNHYDTMTLNLVFN